MGPLNSAADKQISGLGEVIRRAREAQGSWASLPYGERGRKLREASRWLCGHIDDIVETIHRENGKLRIDALAAEVLPAIIGINYYIRRGRAFLRPRKLAGANLLMLNKRSRLEYQPWGVVGIISPWNYPFAIPFAEVVMALLAGNAVILKTAAASTAVGRLLAALFAAAGLPPGLFTQVEIPGREAGPAFINGDGAGRGRPAGVDKLFFTGSTQVGRELMALAAGRLLPLVLELGGADAAVIRADADLDRAAAGIIWAGYSNAGQSCGGVQRILVHRQVYGAFLEKLCARVSALRPGWGEDADLGPMSSLEQKERVEAQVARCLALGARIAARSPAFDGAPGASGPAAGNSAAGPFADRFSPAVVLVDLKPGMPVLEEEVFGPVTAVIPVEDDGEALRIANSSPYSLTASVWSRDRRAASRLASRLNAGAVMLNDHLMSHGLAESPWGGFGDSGLGKTHGEPGFREMLRAKVVVDDILPGIKRNLWWQPYSEGVYRGIRAIAAFLGGPGLGPRLRALPALLKIFFRYWEK